MKRQEGVYENLITNDRAGSISRCRAYSCLAE
jgi:hypothetical protein